MIEKVAKQLFDTQCRCGMLDEKERNLYEYAYNLLICRVIVYLLIVVLGICLGSLKEIIVFLLAFIPLRQYAGGIHLEKTEKCIVVSGVLVCVVGIYLREVSVPTFATFLLWIVAMGCIFSLSPVGCRNKKLDLIERMVYKKRLRILLWIECLIICLTFMIGYSWVSKGMMLAHIILSISLILGYFKEIFLPKS